MSSGGPIGGTRTLAEGRIKCVCKVLAPSGWGLSEVQAWMDTETAQLDSQSAQAQMRASFAQDFATTHSARVSEITNDSGDFQLYPKIAWSGTPKRNTDVFQVCQQTVNALAAIFQADLQAAGFTVTQLYVKDYGYG